MALNWKRATKSYRRLYGFYVRRCQRLSSENRALGAIVDKLIQPAGVQIASLPPSYDSLLQPSALKEIDSYTTDNTGETKSED